MATSSDQGRLQPEGASHIFHDISFSVDAISNLESETKTDISYSKHCRLAHQQNKLSIPAYSLITSRARGSFSLGFRLSNDDEEKDYHEFIDTRDLEY